ncbi:hypothetical protein Lal_00000202 [Lupinus albus]|uniref:Putative U11/U12 small nuclear ribonucleoprotein 48kDa protein n=1 Tax=Lupinus albus TaxID=3870 RepID=A0A6A4NJS3_LUPAL|nr:putative U11/U12 small nuclear ribonucleoprotein 48kDa protein [Lupinus albus]KAF1860789.1 hypothetical protein Lal_00000202 [Lupinus albus]
MENSLQFLPPPPRSSSISTILESLNNLLSLQIPFPPKPLNSNLIQCPFNPNHRMPPSSLFLHHLRCPSSPRLIPDLHRLLHSLTYPNTLNTTTHHSHHPLTFSLDFLSNFFYNNSPAVVSLSDPQIVNTTITLPTVLSIECVDSRDSEIVMSNYETVYTSILPSHYWAISREIELWNDFPIAYSNKVLFAISGIGIANECDLRNWVIVNSPRYGVVIDTPMQQHIFLLCCLCFKSISREAFVSKEKQCLQLDCPILNQALTWLVSQVSVLYGTVNGKLFVLNFVKKCILAGASGLLLFQPQSSDTNSVGIKDAKPDVQHEEKTNWIADKEVFLSQIAAAVAALHERSLLERKIKGFWFSQQPSNYQRASEHYYLSERANEERKKRADFRPLIDHDGLHGQQSSNQETSREKTREELLAEERDYKRRRMSYRGKKMKTSAVQVMRDVIEEYMEKITQVGGVESPVSKESGFRPSKPPSSHDIPMEANYSGKVNHDSRAVTISNPSYNGKHSRTNYWDKSKENRQERYRSHDYAEDQLNTSQGKYHRDLASKSPERHKTHSRPHVRSSHHSGRKKYEHLSGTKDRQQKDSHRNDISDSGLKNAFEDRYVPSESLDVRDDDNLSHAKFIKPDKFKEYHS